MKFRGMASRRKNKNKKKKENMDELDGQSPHSEQDPPPVDPTGAIVPVSLVDSTSIPSLHIGDPGYTTPTPSDQSDKSAYESPDSPSNVKDVRANITQPGSVLRARFNNYRMDDMQNSVFRFLTKEINLDNLFVLEFFDIGLTNFDSIFEVFGELTAVNCIALLDQWLSLDAWEDHSQEITRIYAFSKAVNYIMDNPHYKRKNQPDKLPDIQFHRNSVKRQIKFQLHNAQQELIMTHDSFIRQPMKWHQPDSYTKALPPDSKPGPADAYSHNNTSLPSILKSHSRNTQHFALGGG